MDSRHEYGGIILRNKDAMLDVGKVTITQHAINRYSERFGGNEEKMRDQLSRAVLFGAQQGEDRIYLDDDAAFVLDRFGVVKTTLTRGMLLANMQVAFRGLMPSEPVNAESSSSEIDLQFLASIAEQHCSACFPNCFGKGCRQNRHRQLRKLGISPQDEHRKIYNEMFLCAYREKVAEQLNESAVNDDCQASQTRVK